MDKKLLAAAGTTVTGAAFQLTTVVWPDWIKVHKGVVFALWIGSGCLWAWWGIAHRIAARGNDKSPALLPDKPQQSVDQGNLVGGNNSGRMIANVERYFEAKAESPPPPISKLAPPPIPEMKCRATWICAGYRGGEWTEADSTRFDRKLAVALFENLSASSKGAVGIPLKSIEANLKFHGPKDYFTVNTAYWMDRESNRMDIPPGHVGRVVLGYFSEDTTFTCHENTLTYEINSAFPTSRSLGQATNISSTGAIRIEVTLQESLAPHRIVEKATLEIDVETKTIRVVS